MALAVIFTATVSPAEETRVELTLRKCIDRALEENLNIQSASLGLRKDRWEIERQKSVFDPTLTSEAKYERSKSPNYTSYIPVSSITSKNSAFNLGLDKKLSTGAQVGVGYSASRSESDIETQNYSGRFEVTLSQPLLNGFGKKVAYSDYYIAQLTGKETEWDLRNQASGLVYTIQENYWNLVYAVESLNVARLAVAQAESLLAYNELELQLGMKTESEALESKSAVIDRRQDVIDREKTVRDYEAGLGRLINLSPSGVDPDTRIVPIDRPSIENEDLTPERLLEEALKQRPDYLSALTALNKTELQQGVARNSMLPNLDLSTSYRINGSDDTYGGAFEEMDGTSNGWGLGLTLSYPLGNRATKAAYEKSTIEVQKARLALRDLEQSISVEIHEAIRDVEVQRSKIDAMTMSIEVNQRKLDKEMERYRRNMSTSYLVLEYQTDLADAMMQRQKALVDYNLAVARLKQVTGNILEGMNITVIGGKL